MSKLIRWNEQHLERTAGLGIQPGTGVGKEQDPAPQSAPALILALKSDLFLDPALGLALKSDPLDTAPDTVLAITPESDPVLDITPALTPAPALNPASDLEPGLYPQSFRFAAFRRQSGERGLYPSGCYPSHPACSPSHTGQRYRSGL
ncbi:hypothetical protein M2105_003459 [Paenibacillus sp. PastF-1]|nr:hypothetical protein [Paenibacillus sp. PastF-2]MDF9849025.1 hypothetical protein [Paenibacillus sp. PastM-2]MDF9855595.1 hypothetical protein [Paenibacillus sp. PastF-1]MDH6480867.1 hypothetical protein [Paenibacillus sp. PastH-2]MDH6508289.1 hypothetical protein [Paenibacillus sp. PastM-3]